METHPPATSLEDSWSLAEATYNGRPMFLRINVGLKPLAGKPPFQHRFGVAIPLQVSNEHGLPTAEEAAVLNQIEDALLAAVLPSGQTKFALVITTNGFREFIFYTSQPADLVPIMERFKKETTSRQSQFYIRPDPTWGVYAQFQPAKTI